MRGFYQQGFSHVSKNKMKNIDLLVQNYFSGARTEGMTESMYIFTNIFNLSTESVCVFIFFSLLVYLIKGARLASLFLISITTGSLLVYLIKILFDSARPLDGVMSVFGPSFPSYHATIATIFFIMLMYIFDSYLNTFLQFLFNTLCIFCIFIVAFSRVYLGVHWFSDVFFGVILGSLFSYFCIVVFKHVMNARGDPSMLK